LSILDCPFSFLLKTEGAIKNGQSRETGNIGYTRQWTKKNKKNTHISHHRKLKCLQFSLTFILSCVHNVTSLSGLSILDCPFGCL
jgi:hypothetical protein